MDEQATQPNNRFKFRLVIGVIILIVAIIGSVVALNVYFRSERSRLVVSVLSIIPNFMQQETIGGNGYQQGLPVGMSTNDKVVLTGGGSFDGTTYCFTGTSVEDKSIVYHIDSSDKKAQKGDCKTGQSVTTPTVPTELRVDTVTGTYIGVEWQEVLNASSYTIQCATDATFSQNVISTITKQTNGSCDGLQQQTTYYIRVRGNNTSAGPWSGAVSAQTQLESIAPTMKVTTVSSSEIHYSWNTVNGATSYLVEWSTDLNFAKDVHQLTLNATNGSTTGLQPGTTYFYHVKAITPQFDSTYASFSEIAITTTNK